MMGTGEHRKFDKATPPHIVVIGAGISGLRCADVLLRHGFQVTILEARDRVGGRVHQKKLSNGHWVDMGANWVHGTKDNPVLDIAKQTGTQVGGWDEQTTVFDGSGSLFSVEEGEEHAGHMWEMVESAIAFSNEGQESGSDIPYGDSLFDYFEREIVARIPDTVKDYEKKRRVVMLMSQLWGAFVGSSITTQSLRFMWLEEGIEGENLFCAGTYKKILEAIAQPALTGADVRLRTKAERICYDKASNERIGIYVHGEEKLVCDEVVVTTPLGWLKRNLGAFEPPLPPRLTQAIQSIGYGSLDKVYISFPQAFWLKGDGNSHRRVQGFVQWLSPSYARSSNVKQWHEEAVELASLHRDVAHPTLLFYIYGEQSKYLKDKLAEIPNDDDDDRSKKEAFLLNYFKPYYSRLPMYSEADESCRPTGCIWTDWLNDELAGYGSYSNFQVGLEDGDNDIRAMRHGVPEQGLWLAGEHTAPFLGLGTVTGAYWSGEAVARRIAEAYGKSTEGS